MKMDLVERCENMMKEIGIPVTEFCRRVEISPSCFYRWRAGEIKPGENTLARIEAWVSRFGF